MRGDRKTSKNRVTMTAIATNHSSMGAAANLRQALNDRSNIVVAPGVFDGISARAALSLGFEALYMVGLDVFPLRFAHR